MTAAVVQGGVRDRHCRLGGVCDHRPLVASISLKEGEGRLALRSSLRYGLDCLTGVSDQMDTDFEKAA